VRRRSCRIPADIKYMLQYLTHIEGPKYTRRAIVLETHNIGTVRKIRLFNKLNNGKNLSLGSTTLQNFYLW
jgi:hypothetical protein